jgi:hypothetical protein
VTGNSRLVAEQLIASTDSEGCSAIYSGEARVQVR